MTRGEASRLLTTKKGQPSTDWRMAEALTMAVDALNQCEAWAKNHGPGECPKAMIDEIRKVVKTWREDSWTDGISYDSMVKISDLLSKSKQEPKPGHWVKISPADIYECSECQQNVMTSDICAYRYCHGCGAKMEE